MVPDFDTIFTKCQVQELVRGNDGVVLPTFNVFECDDSISHFVLARDCFPGRKDMLQYLDNSLPQWRSEAVKDQMRKRLAHSSSHAPWNVVS